MFQEKHVLTGRTVTIMQMLQNIYLTVTRVINQSLKSKGQFNIPKLTKRTD